MREQPRRDVSDKFSWWCPQCKTRKTIRESSFFHRSHMTLQQWLLLIYLWAREYPVTDVAEEAEVDKGTAIDVFQWLREVCSTKLIQTPIILGGTVAAVQIDESLFRHKPKVKQNKRNKLYIWECINNIIPISRITEVEQRILSSGCLGLWTLHTSQPCDTWSWWRVEMQPLFCPLSRRMSTQTPQYSRMNGLHTIECSNCRM